MSNSWEGLKVGDLVNRQIAVDVGYAGGMTQHIVVHCPFEQHEIYVYRIVKLPPEVPTAEELIDKILKYTSNSGGVHSNSFTLAHIRMEIKAWKEAQDEHTRT